MIPSFNFKIDILLLINHVKTFSSDTNFDALESHFTLICLPIFNSSGFLHLYISYISKNVCILLLSPKAEDLVHMENARKKIYATCYLKGIGATVGPMNTAMTGKTVTLIEELEKAAERNYTIDDVGIPDLYHFLFKSHSSSQVTQPKFVSPYNTKNSQKRLFRLFQEIHSSIYMLDSTKPHKVYFRHSETETLVAWITSAFELFTVLSPMVTKMQAIKACNDLLKWIKTQEEELFIQNSPVW